MRTTFRVVRGVVRRVRVNADPRIVIEHDDDERVLSLTTRWAGNGSRVTEDVHWTACVAKEER